MTLLEDYEDSLAYAREFLAVVRTVHDAPDLPEPDGARCGKLTWRKYRQDDVVEVRGSIALLFSRGPSVDLRISYITKETPPLLAQAGGLVTFMAGAHIGRHEDAVARFAEAWQTMSCAPAPVLARHYKNLDAIGVE